MGEAAERYSMDVPGFDEAVERAMQAGPDLFEHMDIGGDVQHAAEADSASAERQRELASSQGMETSGLEYDLALDAGFEQLQQVTTESVHGGMTEEEYLTQVPMLNRKQRRVFEKFIEDVKRDEEAVCLFITGGAGTGKSKVLGCMRKGADLICRKRLKDVDVSPVLVMAPTGQAAFIAEGVTIHSALAIPVKRLTLANYTSLDSVHLQRLRSAYKGLRVVMVDECSMIGGRMLVHMLRRLETIKGVKGIPFAGLHMVFFGDPYQLPPVMDVPVWSDLRSNYGAFTVNVWKDQVECFELTEIMRQRDPEFALALNRMRLGRQHMTQEDHHMFAGRNRSDEDVAAVLNRAEQPEKRPMQLFSMNKNVDACNYQSFVDCALEKHEFTARDYLTSDSYVQTGRRGARGGVLKEQVLGMAKALPADKAGGFLYLLSIGIGMRVDVVANLDVEDGLANGSTAIVQAFAESKDTIWVEFPTARIGKKMRAANEYCFRLPVGSALPGRGVMFEGSLFPEHGWTPIRRSDRKFFLKSLEVCRSQFPLRPSDGKTIHRSQGSTYDSVVVDFRQSRNPANSAYVAISRAKELEGVYLKGYNEHRVTTSKAVAEEMARLTSDACSYDATFDIDYVPPGPVVIYQNVASLRKYHRQIESDERFAGRSALVFAESRLMAGEISKFRLGSSCETGYVSMWGPVVSDSARGVRTMATYWNVDEVSAMSFYRTADLSVELVCLIFAPQCTQVVCVYRSPSCTLSELFNELERANVHRSSLNVILMGDFNADILNKTSDGDRMELWMHMHGFHCMLNRVTTILGSALDHVWTNFEGCCAGSFSTHFSDHDAIFVALGGQLVERRRPPSVRANREVRLELEKLAMNVTSVFVRSEVAVLPDAKEKAKEEKDKRVSRRGKKAGAVEVASRSVALRKRKATVEPGDDAVRRKIERREERVAVAEQPLSHHCHVLLRNDHMVHCYANSLLQCLLRLDNLRAVLRGESILPVEQSLCTYFVLCQNATTDVISDVGALVRSVVVTNEVHTAFGAVQQHDSSEFLIAILDCLPEPISSLFKMAQYTNIMCSVCRKVRTLEVTWEKLLFLKNLPELSNIDFVEAINSALSEERQHADAPLECEECGKRQPSVTWHETSVITTDILCVNMGLMQVIGVVDGELRVRRLRRSFKNFDGNILHLGDIDYACKGIVNHHGSDIRSGHYTSWVKCEGGWCLINDNRKDAVGRAAPDCSLTDAFLLFFEKT